jgi:hypothetical protein
MRDPCVGENPPDIWEGAAVAPCTVERLGGVRGVPGRVSVPTEVSAVCVSGLLWRVDLCDPPTY